MGHGDDELGEDEVLELLAEAADEAMSPVVDDLWVPLLPAVLAELEREDSEHRPSIESVLDRMKANGLPDPEDPPAG